MKWIFPFFFGCRIVIQLCILWTNVLMILKDKTFKDELTSVKLDVSHFCVFGFLIYIGVCEEKRTKL
jgi:hypothetical protein